MQSLRKSAGVVLASLLLATTALAASPSLSTVLPRGGQRGTDVPVTFHGARLGDANDVFFHDPGITVSEIAADGDGKVNAKLTIAPDTPVGPRLIRLRTRSGISNAIVFSVGNLPQRSEVEPNSRTEEAEPLELNHTIEGVVQSEDVDYYAVELKTGDRLAVEIEALRLGGTLFDPKVRLFGPEGHERVSADDTQILLQDAGFAYEAIEDGTHRIAVSEASYGGNGSCYYRLHVGTFPRPLMVSPLGGPPATELQATWFGDPALGTLPVAAPGWPFAAIPAVEGIDPATIGRVDGVKQPLMLASDLGVAPTTFSIRTVDVPNTMEAEPNNDLATATPATGPGALEGVISEPGDIDFFSIEGLAHGAYDVRVWARELGSPLDSVLNIYKPDNAHLAGNDDSVGTDSLQRITVDQDGAYKFRVRDHLDSGGATYAYRIEVLPVKPRFTTGVLNNRPASLTVHQGACHFLLANVARKDFNEEIQLVLDGVPAGVTAELGSIAKGGTSTPIFFSAAPDAPVSHSALRIIGLGQVGEQYIAGELDQEVRLVTGNNDSTFHQMRANRIAAAVAEPPPFKLTLVEPQAPIVHHSGRALKVEIERSEGFESEVTLSFPWLPSGMKGGTAKIPGDQTSATIRLECDANTGDQEHLIFVQASAAGYVFCSPRVRVKTEPRWITFVVPDLETEQGKNIELVAEAQQTKPFEGEFDVKLMRLPKGVTAEPVKVTKDSTEARFQLTVAEDAAVGKHQHIMADVSVVVNGEDVRNVSGAGNLKVYEPLPPELQAKAEEAKAEAPKPEEEDTERKTRFPSS